MNDESKERHIERIRKLLALSGSSNEHEAAIARSRAESLMEKYAISQAMLGQAEFGSGEFATGTKDRATWKWVLYGSIGYIFGCQSAFYTHWQKGTMYVYYGKKPSVEIALYVCDVVTRSLKAKWKEHLQLLKSHGMIATPKTKADFHHHFAVGVARKIREIFSGMTDQEKHDHETALSEAEEHMEEMPEARTRKAKPKEVDQFAARMGYEAGASQNINIGVGQSQHAKIGE